MDTPRYWVRTHPADIVPDLPSDLFATEADAVSAAEVAVEALRAGDAKGWVVAVLDTDHITADLPSSPAQPVIFVHQPVFQREG